MPAMQQEYDDYLNKLFLKVKAHQISEQAFFKAHVTSGVPFLPGPVTDQKYLHQIANHEVNGDAFAEAVKAALGGRRFDMIVELNALIKLDVARIALAKFLYDESFEAPCVEADTFGVQKIQIKDESLTMANAVHKALDELEQYLGMERPEADTTAAQDMINHYRRQLADAQSMWRLALSRSISRWVAAANVLKATVDTAIPQDWRTYTLGALRSTEMIMEHIVENENLEQLLSFHAALEEAVATIDDAMLRAKPINGQLQNPFDAKPSDGTDADEKTEKKTLRAAIGESLEEAKVMIGVRAAMNVVLNKSRTARRQRARQRR